MTKWTEIKKNITWLEGFRHGLAEFHVRQEGKELYGVLNAAGEIVLEPQPRWLMIFDENTVGLGNSKVLDLKSNNIYPSERYWAQKYGGAITTRYGKKGLTDINGNIIILHKYRYLCRRADASYMACNRKNKWGILDSCGKELVPFEYDALSGYEMPDRISAKQGDDWFVIDRSGQRLSEKRYDYLDSFTKSGYAIFGEKQVYDWTGWERMRYGIIDKDETITIPAVYDCLLWLLSDDSQLSCGITDSWNSGLISGPCWKHGVIDCRGNMIISPSYHDFFDCKGLSRTYIAHSHDQPKSSIGEIEGVIDESDRAVIPFRDWMIRRHKGDAYWIYDRQLERCGLYSPSGEGILPFEYDMIDFMGDTLDYIAVRKNGEWYYVNRHGERVLL